MSMLKKRADRIWFGITALIALGPSFIITNIMLNITFHFKEIFTQKRPFSWVALRPSFNLWLVYLLMFKIVWAICFGLYIKWHALYGDLRVGNKATSRFSSYKEIKHTYKSVPYFPTEEDEYGHIVKYKGDSGVLISRFEGIAYIDVSDLHVLWYGRTRSGKDESILLPEIELASRSEEQPHIVCTTTKYETIEKVKAEMISRGYRVECLNLVDPDKSFGFNPLSLAVEAYDQGDIDDAVELCKTFTHSQFHEPNAHEKVWQNGSRGLTNANILGLCEIIFKEPLLSDMKETISIYGIANMMIQLSGKTVGDDNSIQYKADKYFESLPLTSVARQQFSGVGLSGGQMRSSIMASTGLALLDFLTPKLNRMTRRTTFDFANLTQSGTPYFVMIVLPDYTDNNYTIATTWIEQCYFYLSRYATLHGDRLPKRVRFYLNEFGNLPAFKSIQSMLSVGAGRGMLFEMFLQADEQLTIKYGKDTADFIRDQVMNIGFIASSSLATRKKFSESLGKKEVTERTRSGNPWSFNKNVSEKTDSRPLLTPDELSRLLEGENVIMRSKRKSDQFEDAIPYPIFNTGPHRFMFAYQYLSDVFTRQPFDSLGLQYHGNQDWDESMLTRFVDMLDARIIEAPTEASVKLTQVHKERDDQMKQLEPYNDRYGAESDVATIEGLTDQTLTDETVYASPLYILISEAVVKDYPELMDELNQVVTESDLNSFIRRHINAFEDLV